jgi:hypothetical protein
MLTPVSNEYGLGFELDHAGKAAAFHHSGSTIGYKALLFAYTQTGQGAVILTNGDGAWPLIEELMRVCSRIWLGRLPAYRAYGCASADRSV